MFRKILIANRGEIACRIARSVRALGLDVATVHSDADADAPHVLLIGESVRLGPAPARDSYLNINAVIAAAQRVGADAIHPGYGFLSENPAFAQACATAGLHFIGPSPQTLALFGDKSAARHLAARLGIPVAQGTAEPSDDVDTVLASLAQMPLPSILKAVAGGGGKGMRVVHKLDEARAAIEAVVREGRSAFGDGRMIAEQYLLHPRHVEVQILGDGTGQVIHLFDRECSLQRRHQKVLEEAPVSSLGAALRAQLQGFALALGRATQYRGLGTVEFAVTAEGPVFLEVNPRLQVEHTVTEAVLGLDLVALQIETVARGAMPLLQAEVPSPKGVAVQARLYAEDPAQGFVPSTGRLTAFAVPDSVRCDTGVCSGSTITPHYDPMVAKLIAHAPTRVAALDQLAAALQGTVVDGVAHNAAMLVDLLRAPGVRANDVHTGTLDAWLPLWQATAPPQAAVAALCLVALLAQRGSGRADATPRAPGAWGDAALAGWRLRRASAAPAPPALAWQARLGEQGWRVGLGPPDASGTWVVRLNNSTWPLRVPQWDDGATAGSNNGAVRARIEHDGCTWAVAARCEQPGLWVAQIGPHHLALALTAALGASASAAHTSDTVRAPMMGLMVAVDVTVGQQVDAGERLAVIESMKMELPIRAPHAGRVDWVGCGPQAQVERHQDLFRIQAATPASGGLGA